ncbi:MAG: ATPase, T2SS/T4P/T4SS family, partial [Acidimicrobiia bacterium]
MKRPAGGVVEFSLRDGGTGTAVFPPAAPRGPVVTLRRAEPGSATFDRLIVADVLDRRMADLLRLAAHCRLNVLVAGPPGSGKTALLAALVRDRDEARVVTVSRGRVFRWPSPSKVELVAVPNVTPLPALVAAGAGLQPDLLVVDSVQLEDVPALVERLARGGRGTVAAVEPESLAFGLTQSVDLVLRLGRSRDGQHRVVAMLDGKGSALFVHEEGGFRHRGSTPSFSAAVGALGLGEALASVLR